MELQPSTSELLKPTNYLDSNIAEDSGLRQALQELLKIDPDLTRVVVLMEEDTIRSSVRTNCDFWRITFKSNLVKILIFFVNMENSSMFAMQNWVLPTKALPCKTDEATPILESKLCHYYAR